MHSLYPHPHWARASHIHTHTLSPCVTLAAWFAGKSEDQALGYDWAIVTAGAPKSAFNGKCRTGNALGLNQGESAFQTLNLMQWIRPRSCQASNTQAAQCHHNDPRAGLLTLALAIQWRG